MRDIQIIHGVNSATIGRVGENGVAQLMMDASDWESEFPGGSLALFMERADGVSYIAAVERTDAGWAHILTAARAKGIPTLSPCPPWCTAGRWTR